MAKVQAVELAAQNIRVNCILPGRVDTPLISRDNISKEQVEANKHLYPLKRYARPEEIAYYAIYLLSCLLYTSYLLIWLYYLRLQVVLDLLN